MRVGREQRTAARGERPADHPRRAADRRAREACGVPERRDPARVVRGRGGARARRGALRGRLVDGRLRLRRHGFAADAARKERARAGRAELAHDLLEHDLLDRDRREPHATSFTSASESAGDHGSAALIGSSSASGGALFPRAHAREPRVHAGGVGLEHATPHRALQGRVAAREAGEVERARLAIRREPRLADQLRSAARGDAPEPEHLREAILRVREAEREPGVVLVRGAHVGHAAPIAHHRHGRLDPRHDQRALERRMRGAQRAPRPRSSAAARPRPAPRARCPRRSEPASARAPPRPAPGSDRPRCPTPAPAYRMIPADCGARPCAAGRAGSGGGRYTVRRPRRPLAPAGRIARLRAPTGRRVQRRPRRTHAADTEGDGDMAVAVGINGFGRIGRLAFRGMATRTSRSSASTTSSSAPTLAHLLKCDSVHGQLPRRRSRRRRTRSW